MMIQTHHHPSSTKGLSSLTTLLTTPTTSLLIDPPFLLPDALSTLSWISSLTPHPPSAIFLTHHHPDHFFSANPILSAFPNAKLYAAPYVLARINNEYDQKIKYWNEVLEDGLVPEVPRRPEPYPWSFFVLGGEKVGEEGEKGEGEEVVVLLGPVQGDCVDQTIFWIPGERTVVAGDVVFGRSGHVWVEELDSPALLEAWLKTLDMIEQLHPVKIIPGHMEAGWELDAEADLAHTRRYLQLFGEKVTYADKKLGVQELYEFFRDAFPQCRENLDFFLGHMANRFGEGGTVWEENRHQEVGEKRPEELSGYWLGGSGGMNGRIH
ncbi:metallo-beta-lactamase domain protein [Aspergillus ibericus CBS 121593]|uniref:Metallo-beta-lactamase domain protein n=1 Tax=Aspergillus ibericus CBS 121593 TaxID=1448316 RepID=A0A395H1E7_9EURO|nr:metallo-beta-lactamase domain protein [Aspergillus ibericus CBS 121593]RAL01045.1 metallo-beta-lactamase domain protein [Aspergillus ibericus CBS 121593]